VQLSGIELQMYHSEAAPGQVSSPSLYTALLHLHSQYEVITGPLSPLKAADALVHTREIIYNIANKHGLRATLAPRVYKNSCKSRTYSTL
jgi:glutamine synthetase